METQCEKLVVSARCSPGRIVGNHPEDQGPALFADTLPSSYLADSGDARPIQTIPRSADDDYVNPEEFDRLKKAQQGVPEFQLRINWSLVDTGSCESAVQKELVRLDNGYGTTMYDSCVRAHFGSTPFGRACVMESYACTAALNRSDQQAFEIMVATQLHNDEAVAVLRQAGIASVTDYLRKVCR